MRDSRLPSPAESPGYLLWQAGRAWQRSVAAALRPVGLTHVQFILLGVLVWLTRVGGPGALPTQRALAQAAATDPVMTSQVVRALEARGLLVRRRDAGGARAIRVAPTPEGRELVTGAIGLVEAADEAFFADVDDDEVVRVLRALAGRHAAPDRVAREAGDQVAHGA